MIFGFIHYKKAKLQLEMITVKINGRSIYSVPNPAENVFGVHRKSSNWHRTELAPHLLKKIVISPALRIRFIRDIYSLLNLENLLISATYRKKDKQNDDVNNVLHNSSSE